MERPERYDPEDLEHLMLERGFDELLEEERAYALRHLEGRAEYERMRALLHHVREDKRDHATMDAEPAVRERVMAAFRAQQRPQWQIWLNSVGGLLLPARPSMYWRPALALGTVAVLIFASLMTWRAMEPQENKVLAEVKPEVPAPSAPPGTTVQEEQVQPATAAGKVEQTVMPNAVTYTLSSATRMEEAEVTKAPVTASAIAKDNWYGVDETTKLDAPMTTSATAPAATGNAQRTLEEPVMVAHAERRQTAENEDSITPMADVAEVKATRGGLVAADSKKQEAPAYSEDDLLGLLRAAW